MLAALAQFAGPPPVTTTDWIAMAVLIAVFFLATLLTWSVRKSRHTRGVA